MCEKRITTNVITEIHLFFIHFALLVNLEDGPDFQIGLFLLQLFFFPIRSGKNRRFKYVLKSGNMDHALFPAAYVAGGKVLYTAHVQAGQ